MLSVTDGVFPIVCAFTVIVETECARGDVESRGDLGEKTVADEGFARAAYADEEDDEFVCWVGEEGGDCVGIGRELLVGDLRILTTNQNQCVCEGIEKRRSGTEVDVVVSVFVSMLLCDGYECWYLRWRCNCQIKEGEDADDSQGRGAVQRSARRPCDWQLRRMMGAMVGRDRIIYAQRVGCRDSHKNSAINGAIKKKSCRGANGFPNYESSRSPVNSLRREFPSNFSLT